MTEIYFLRISGFYESDIPKCKHLALPLQYLSVQASARLWQRAAINTMAVDNDAVWKP